ncbi:fasciclin domain-containing protein [Streptomyces sp. NPDC001985]|uniref:fasciclin domain-containing protein n=1 Tax=Streptomyces sp. NPDC001985 TaxID=3154406 RepID=UPI0033206A84
MNTLRFRRTAIAVTAAAVLPFTLAACSDAEKDTSSDSAQAESGKDDTQEQEPTAPEDGAAMAGDKPFGTACGSIPKEGSGSFDGMAKDPVATAASNNPALSTLVTAVTKAGLADTLNKAEGITVFAPTNDAFAKIPKADLDKVLADKEMLTQVLTYHVVGENLTPAQLKGGTFDTLQKSTLTTAASGDTYTVNDTAKVVCGNVSTSNATVHIVDTVLMPK